MVRYIFKLKKAYIPDLTHENEKDRLYGGTRLTYAIYRSHFVRILKGTKFEVLITYYSRKLGDKTFLRPFKKYWDKRTKQR